MVRFGFRIEKLSDELGVYDLTATCPMCQHSRAVRPALLAVRFGWEAKLFDVQAKLVCTGCGHKGALLDAKEIRRPRGYRSH